MLFSKNRFNQIIGDNNSDNDKLLLIPLFNLDFSLISYKEIGRYMSIIYDQLNKNYGTILIAVGSRFMGLQQSITANKVQSGTTFFRNLVRRCRDVCDCVIICSVNTGFSSTDNWLKKMKRHYQTDSHIQFVLSPQTWISFSFAASAILLNSGDTYTLSASSELNSLIQETNNCYVIKDNCKKLSMVKIGHYFEFKVGQPDHCKPENLIMISFNQRGLASFSNISFTRLM